MYYFIFIIFTVLSLLAGYKQNKLFLSLTQGESFISPEKLGTVRSYIYAFSIIISFIIDIVNYISGWVEYSSSIANPFMPLSFLYGEAYGASAAMQVFIVLLFEVVFVCSVCFLRGLSLKMIIHYIMDGNCTEYKYIKKLTRVLVLAFLGQILLFIATAIESSLILQITGENYDIDSSSSIVAYNSIWIICFLTLSNSYKNKIKSSPEKQTKNQDQQTKKQKKTEPYHSENFTDKCFNIYNNEEPRDIKETPKPEGKSTQKLNASLSPDEARLAEIETELKKIPVAKVKQWYADGKLSDEQYKAIARKYNTLKKERDDTKERLELLKNIGKD